MSNCLSSLYILEIRPQSEVGLVKIFSHFIGCHFFLMTVFFALQKLFRFKRPHLLIVSLSVCAFSHQGSIPSKLGCATVNKLHQVQNHLRGGVALKGRCPLCEPNLRIMIPLCLKSSDSGCLPVRHVLSIYRCDCVHLPKKDMCGRPAVCTMKLKTEQWRNEVQKKDLVLP